MAKLAFLTRTATSNRTSLFPYKLPIPMKLQRILCILFICIQRIQGHSFWSTKGHNSAGTKGRKDWCAPPTKLLRFKHSQGQQATISLHCVAIFAQPTTRKELEVGSNQYPANPGLCGALLLLSGGTSRWSHTKPSTSWESAGMHHFSVHLPCVWEKILLFRWWQKS